MMRNKRYAFSLAATLVFCSGALASSAPVVSAQSAPPAAPQSQEIIKTEFVVYRMLYQSLQVRSFADVHTLHTFTYSPEIRDKMQKVFNAGGYQYGDKVVIWYRQGSEIALNIKGKPSKKK